MLDTGVRASELVGMKLADLDMDLDVIYVVGKGSRPRSVVFGSRAGVALDRYLRERARHPMSARPELWLGSRQQGLTDSGIRQMLERRGAEANVPHLHAHRLRHSFAHYWRVNGGSEDDLMRLGGWKSRTMLARYGASAGGQRAFQAHKSFSPADHL
jgi:site-specific recombinase XerD